MTTPKTKTNPETTPETPKTPRGRKAKANPRRANTLHAYFDPAQLARLESRVGPDDSKNNRLQDDLATYYAALDLGLAHARRILTRSEAKALLDVMNGTYWDSNMLGMMLGGGITINVQDGIALNRLDTKWGFDGPPLIRKLTSMDRLCHLGLLDFCRQFWIHHETLDTDEYVSGFQESE